MPKSINTKIENQETKKPEFKSSIQTEGSTRPNITIKNKPTIIDFNKRNIIDTPTIGGPSLDEPKNIEPQTPSELNIVPPKKETTKKIKFEKWWLATLIPVIILFIFSFVLQAFIWSNLNSSIQDQDSLVSALEKDVAELNKEVLKIKDDVQDSISQDPTTPVNFDFPAPVVANENYRGDPNARYIWVEYVDLQCPACKSFHQSMSQYTSQNSDLTWVFRHYPLVSIHPYASKFAQATECSKDQAGLDGFWIMVDLIMENQSRLTDQNIYDLATQAAIDQNNFTNCLDSEKFSTKITQDYNQADTLLSPLGFGTPTSIIYDTENKKMRVIFGSLTYDKIQEEFTNFKKQDINNSI